MYLSFFIYLSICLSVCLSIFIYSRPIYVHHFFLFIFLSIYLSIYLSVCLSVCLFTYLPLSTYLSFHLSNPPIKFGSNFRFGELACRLSLTWDSLLWHLRMYSPYDKKTKILETYRFFWWKECSKCTETPERRKVIHRNSAYLDFWSWCKTNGQTVQPQDLENESVSGIHMSWQLRA